MAEEKKRNTNLTLLEKIDIIKNKKLFPLIFSVSVLSIISILFGILTGGRFFGRTVLTGIFQQSIIVGVVSIGASFIYSTGDVDFSVGNVMGLAAALGALSYQQSQSVAAMIAVTIMTALILMLFNCTLSVIFKVKSAMVAIVAMTLYSAITIELVGANPIAVDYKICRTLENGWFRYATFISFVIASLVIYHLTPLGRKLRFIGGNETCSKQTGISSMKSKYLAFVVTGIGVGLGGVYTIIRSGSVANTAGNGMGMDVMLAVVLGGMSLFGGARSNAYSGFIGAMTVTALNKGLLMVGVESSIIQGVRGLLFLLLVFMNSERQLTLPTKQQF